MSTTAFSLDEYLAGQPVVMSDGEIPVPHLKELRYTESDSVFLTALTGEKSEPTIWNTDGTLQLGPDTASSLLMSNPITYYWAVTENLLNTDPDNPAYSKVQLAVLP